MNSSTILTPQAIFFQHYQLAKRDELAGVLLALFLGSLGIHHFYLRRTGMGILYLCFCWTGIPALLGLIECFFMPGRVREFNAILAASLAASLGIAVPGWPEAFPQAAQPGTLVACPSCAQTNPRSARFCSTCGNSLP